MLTASWYRRSIFIRMKPTRAAWWFEQMRAAADGRPYSTKPPRAIQRKLPIVFLPIGRHCATQQPSSSKPFLR